MKPILTLPHKVLIKYRKIKILNTHISNQYTIKIANDQCTLLQTTLTPGNRSNLDLHCPTLQYAIDLRQQYVLLYVQQLEDKSRSTLEELKEQYGYYLTPNQLKDLFFLSYIT